MKDFREIENLSAYLDGQLDSKESAKLESRLKSDPKLESALRDLRSARGVLRQLPARKAPRNFTLTRQMVGRKPPLPRSYPLIRFATVFASILFLLSFTASALSPFAGFGGAAAPVQSFGMGGGCEDCEGAPAQEAAAATEAPATEESFAAEMAPAATEAPPAEDLAPPPSAVTESAEILPTEGARVAESTPSLKDPAPEPSADESAPETTNQPEVEVEAPRVSINWTMLFLGIAILGAIILWSMKFTARNKWR